LLLLVLAIAQAPDAAFGEGVFWHHDLKHHHYPWRVWAARTWAAGEMPLWSPEVGLGFPLMAALEGGALYPPTMGLFQLLPSSLALNWSVLLHQVWAGLGTWLLARTLGRTKLAAGLAAVAFSLSGFLVTHTLYLGMQNGAAWLPFTLFALARAAQSSRRHGWWAGAGLGLSMMVLAGDPQVAVYGWILGGVFVLWRLGRPVRAAHLAALGAAVAAAALAAPQIAATLELAGHGLRSGGVDTGFAGAGSLPPQELLNGVLPELFGFDRPADIEFSHSHRGNGYWGAGESHWEMAFYLGIPTLGLALWSRGQRFWLILAGVSVVLMLGRHTPVYAGLRWLPGLSSFRFPVRFSLWLTLAMAMLAATGLDILCSARPASLRRGLKWGALAVALGWLGLVSVHAGLQLRAPQMTRVIAARLAVPDPSFETVPGSGVLNRAGLPVSEPRDPAWIPGRAEQILASLLESTAPNSPQTLWPLGIGAALLLAAWLLAERRIGAPAFAAGCIALLVLDLDHFGGDYHPRVARLVAETPPSFLSAIDPAEGRVTVVGKRISAALDAEAATASLGLLWGLDDVIVPSPLLITRSELLARRAGLDLGRGSAADKARTLSENLAIAELMGVRYLLSEEPLNDARLQLLRPGPLFLYRNPAALPRAFLVACAHPVEGPDQAWQALGTLDLSREAAVEASPEALPDCGASSPGSAIIHARTATALSIDVETDRDALLVIASTWYPGWQATVGGVPTEIFRADFAFRGVRIPAGAHRVALSYRPAWLRPSLALAVLGLLGLGALAVPGLRPLPRHLFSGARAPLPPWIPDQEPSCTS
jgi:hypothetical protein